MWDYLARPHGLLTFPTLSRTHKNTRQSPQTLQSPASMPTLLTLPAEVRNQIWEYCVTHHELLWIACLHSACKCSSMPAVLATCQQVRNEARNMYFHCNIFRVDVRWEACEERERGLHSLLTWLLCIGPEACEALHRVEITTYRPRSEFINTCDSFFVLDLSMKHPLASVPGILSPRSVVIMEPLELSPWTQVDRPLTATIRDRMGFGRALRQARFIGALLSVGEKMVDHEPLWKFLHQRRVRGQSIDDFATWTSICWTTALHAVLKVCGCSEDVVQLGKLFWADCCAFALGAAWLIFYSVRAVERAAERAQGSTRSRIGNEGSSTVGGMVFVLLLSCYLQLVWHFYM